MKMFKSCDKRHNTLGAKLASLVTIWFLLIGGSCTEAEIKEYEVSEPCFTRESLEAVPWTKAELAWFQRPNMSFLSVIVYSYKGEYYLAFENPTLSGPASHIFNCAGQNLGDLKIHYNEFYDNSELIAVLLTDKY